MDEIRLKEQITRAVDSHCAHLHADPLLAQKVLRATERKERPIVRRKLKFGVVLALILMLLTATAVAAVLLSGMELIRQEAVPLAQGNDGEVRPVEDFTYEELQAIIGKAQENGIILDDDTSIMRALRMGEGYSEEETIMAICQEAFGGLYSDWTMEERYFFQETMVQIGFSSENTMVLPGEGELSNAEARALSVRLLREAYGADLPLDDRSAYRVQEWYYPGGDDQTLHWSYTYYPCFLDGSIYHVTFDKQGANVWHEAEPWEWGDYTEKTLVDRVDSVYNYRRLGTGMISWEYDAWFAFGQKLPGAVHSAAWKEEYDGYAASTYLLPGEGDLTKKQARDIVFADAGVKDYADVTELLLGKGEQRIWKISFATSEKTDMRQVLSYEIDSASGTILRMDDLTEEKTWARYMLQETYALHAPDKADILTQAKALEKAVAALYARLDRSDIPYLDETAYRADCRYNNYTGGYQIIFYPQTMEYGKASLSVDGDGTVRIWFANEPGLNGDNLFDRFQDVYGTDMYWTQDIWVKFGEEMKNYKPATFEGKLFKQTTYLPESAVTITRDKALDIVCLDSNCNDFIRVVLIDAQPHPVWKIRASTEPVTTLYEVDAMTGEILDREYYFIQMPNFDHTMKMYTLRSVYMPAALAEFGVKRIAMELCVKAYVDNFAEVEPDFLMSGAYRITEEGMTVSFMAVDPRNDSYIVTVAEDGMSAEIQHIPGVENDETLSADQQAELYALFEGSDRFQPLEELPEPYQDLEKDYGPIAGEMTLEEAQAHAFALLVDAVGQDTVDSFGKFAVGYRFSRFQNEGNCIRWTFFFVSPENANEGFRVTFAIRDNELWGTGQVTDVNDTGNG